MAKCLVTGGAGFMGSHVCDELLHAGHSVVAIDDLSGGFLENVPTGVDFRQMSITDHEQLDELFREEQFDHVFHLAAYAAEGLSHFIRRYNYTNNLIGSANLINCSVRSNVSSFIFTSSIAVYGDPSELPVTEKVTPLPEDPYGIAKLAVEYDLAAAHELFGLPFVVFRPHNVYGERQNIGDRYRNVVGIFMNQILKGEPLTVFGDGEQSRAFTHISDVAPIIAKAPWVEGAANQVFNLGADEPYTVNVLAQRIQEAMKAPGVELRHLPARSEVQHVYADHSRLREVFEWAPSIDLDEGLRRMAAWVHEHGARATSKFTAIEVEEGLPPSWRV